MKTLQKRRMAKIYKNIEHYSLGAILSGSQIKLISLKFEFERGNIYWLGQMRIHSRKKRTYFITRQWQRVSHIPQVRCHCKIPHTLPWLDLFIECWEST